eukprot:6198864-Pleurochrysis_carterae.AAC.1
MSTCTKPLKKWPGESIIAVTRTCSRDALLSRLRGSKSPSGGTLPGRPYANSGSVKSWERGGPRSGGGRMTTQNPAIAACIIIAGTICACFQCSWSKSAKRSYQQPLYTAWASNLNARR